MLHAPSFELFALERQLVDLEALSSDDDSQRAHHTEDIHILDRNHTRRRLIQKFQRT